MAPFESSEPSQLSKVIKVSEVLQLPYLVSEHHLLEFGALPKSHLKYKIAGSDKKIDRALEQLMNGGWLTITKGKNAEGYTCRIVAITDKPWTPAPRLYGN